MSNGTILLVDDDDSNRLTLGCLLEEAGYSVVEAESATAARQKLSSASFHAAILDLNLGDGLGTELVEPFKAIHPAAAVLLLTGDANVPRERGIDRCLTKGDSPEQLISHIARELSLRRGEQTGVTEQ